MEIEASEEIDFTTEIVSSDDGSISIEPMYETEEEETETEVETEVEKEVEEEETETETEIETETEETEIEVEEGGDITSFESFEATVNGTKITIDSLDEAKKLINNLSRPAPRQPDTWEQAQKELGVTTKDLALISAIKGGDKDALLYAAKQSGLDISQLIYDDAPESFDKDFVPTVETEGQRIMNEISTSGELETFSSMIDQTDQDFIKNLADVKNLNAFRAQVASGKAAELMPLAKKMAALENITLFQAYAKVGHEQAAKAKEETVDTKETTKKTPPVKKAKKSGKEAKAKNEDVWSMSDEEFDAKYGGRKI